MNSTRTGLKGSKLTKLTKQSERLERWKEMPLHGQFVRQTEEVRTEDSWMWLRRGELKRETESLLIAAQDQALATNSIKKRYHRTTDYNKCQLCGEKVESVTHIVSAFDMLAQGEYKRRHDKVCLFIHWKLCKL